MVLCQVSSSPVFPLWIGYIVCRLIICWWCIWLVRTVRFQLRVVSGILPAMSFSLDDFWSQIGVVILVTPKQEVEWKREWLCGVKFFCSKFKVEWENGVWTKIRFLASGFLFTCGNFTLIYTVFSIFWIGFFSKWFPNPFIVRSRSSFLFSQRKFFELYVRTCPAMFFNSLKLISLNTFSLQDLLTIFFSKN